MIGVYAESEFYGTSVNRVRPIFFILFLISAMQSKGTGENREEAIDSSS